MPERQQKSDTHKCFAHNCRARVGTAYLMCTKHWAMVPYTLQQEIRLSLSRGDKKAYNDAIVAARDHVKGAVKR